MEKMHEKIDFPDWDVALAALFKEEYQKLGQALQIDDFHRLAVEYSIRFDDIMDTMFELTIQGIWVYQSDVDKQIISRESIDALYVNGRLHEDDLKEFTGRWSLVE